MLSYANNTRCSVVDNHYFTSLHNIVYFATLVLANLLKYVHSFFAVGNSGFFWVFCVLLLVSVSVECYL